MEFYRTLPLFEGNLCKKTTSPQPAAGHAAAAPTRWATAPGVALRLGVGGEGVFNSCWWCATIECARQIWGENPNIVAFEGCSTRIVWYMLCSWKCRTSFRQMPVCFRECTMAMENKQVVITRHIKSQVFKHHQIQFKHMLVTGNHHPEYGWNTLSIHYICCQPD